MSRELPIIFSASMVRAILEGRKTQTRRVIAPQPVFYSEQAGWSYKGHEPCDDISVHARYRPGDLLYVRESSYIAISGFGAWYFQSTCVDDDGRSRFVSYAASMSDGDKNEMKRICGVKCTPSIHVPKWASRIWLRVKDVRAERLQDISHDDAIAEGCRGHDWVKSSPYISGAHTDAGELPVEEFERLWRHLNDKRPGCAWADNPWVWVIEFEPVDRGAKA